MYTIKKMISVLFRVSILPRREQDFNRKFDNLLYYIIHFQYYSRTQIPQDINSFVGWGGGKLSTVSIKASYKIKT